MVNWHHGGSDRFVERLEREGNLAELEVWVQPETCVFLPSFPFPFPRLPSPFSFCSSSSSSCCSCYKATDPLPCPLSLRLFAVSLPPCRRPSSPSQRPRLHPRDDAPREGFRVEVRPWARGWGIGSGSWRGRGGRGKEGGGEWGEIVDQGQAEGRGGTEITKYGASCSQPSRFFRFRGSNLAAS